MTVTSHLNIGALARRSGIPAVTLRAWERRYGVPTPTRTPSGRRLYSEEDLASVIRMRQLVAEGVAPSVAARQIHQSHEVIHQDPSTAARLASGYAERFISACMSYDETRADEVLTDALLVYSVERVCLDIIEPALARIGDLWWSGDLPVAAEHIASSLIRDRLAVLSRSFASANGRRLAVLSCAPGELHEIGPSMLGLFLRRRGWRVVSLGQNTPIRDIERVATALRPNVVVVSATQQPAARQATNLCERLAPRLADQDTLIAFGGQGFREIRDGGLRSWCVLLPVQVDAAIDMLESTLDGDE